MLAARVCWLLLTAVALSAAQTAFASASVPALPTVAVADAGQLTVAVRVRAALSERTGSRWAGLLALSVPLACFTQPALAEHRGSTPRSGSAGPHRSAASPDHPAKQPPAPTAKPAPLPVTPGHPSRAHPRGGRDAARSAIELDAVLARATVRVALRAAGFAAGAQRLASLSSRARTSAALPQLRVRGGSAIDESLRLSPTADDPYRYTQAGGYERFVELQLTWKLDRLVFSTAELRLETARRQRAQAKARLVERVLGVLFAWQRARTKLVNATLLPEERAMVVLDQLEAEVMLDVYTAGWFTRRQRLARTDP